MLPYQYQPIDEGPREIRLVNLLPGQFEDEIEVELLHTQLPDRLPTKPAAKKSHTHPGVSHSLPQDGSGILRGIRTFSDLLLREKNSPAYEALSYVWGPEEDSETIAVRDATPQSVGRVLLSTLRGSSNHKEKAHPHILKSATSTLDIRNNLGLALRHLRNPVKSRMLWIDAICINQKDVKERNHEVSKMGEIYSKARRVVIWLGPEGEKSSLAMRTLLNFAEDVSDEFALNPAGYPYRKEGTKTERFLRGEIPWDDENEPWLAMRRLLERPWFTRLWVYQECQLSAEGVVVAGRDTIPLAQFVLASVWFVQVHASQQSPSASQKLFASVDIIRPASALKVGELVCKTKRCECQDPRDRIYAIMNLFPRTFTYDVRPDYELPVEDVYKDFFRAYLLYQGQFYLYGYPLVSNVSPQHPRSIPSWLPDLACPVEVPSFGQAGQNSLHETSYSKTDDSLRLCGIQVDKIFHVYEGVPIRASDAEILTLCLSWEPTDLFTGLYRDGRILLDAFIETLLCGQNKEILSWSRLPSSIQLQ